MVLASLKRGMSHKARKSVQRYNLYAGSIKKGERHYSNDRKSKKTYISPIWKESPSGMNLTKICMKNDVSALFTYPKFQSETFKGYDLTESQTFHLVVIACTLRIFFKLFKIYLHE